MVIIFLPPIRCGAGNISACILSVNSVAALSDHLTQIRDHHLSVFDEDLVSQQCYGSAVFHVQLSAVDSVTRVIGGCCALSRQQHCVPPSLC